MAICKFFQQGSCRNGNSCNYEHVSPQNKWGSSTTTGAATTAKYNEGSIKIDLTEARPQWKLSNYGPAKEEPNLIVGVDRSVEEDRFLYYTSMRTTGNNTQYIASHEQLFNQVETQVNAIIGNTAGALQHYEKEKSNHSGPFGGAVNRAPFSPFTNTGGAFGSTPNAFGQTSAFGSAKPSAFGQPSAFGTTTAAAKPSAFGSTSTLGGSAFGSTSTLGGGGSGSAFGSTNALGSGSAFGSTSALGGGSAFGATSALGGTTSTTSAFGQPSAFGAASAKPSAFGGAPTTSAFGSTSAVGGGSAFGSTSTLGGGGAFGATTTAAPAFGATSGLGSSTPAAFGSAPTASTGITTAGAFGQPSTLGAFGTANTTATAASTAMSGDKSSTMDAKQPPASDLEAFSAPQFTFRAIPEVEPPIQLR